MQFSEFQKVLLNATTICAWAIGIGITVVAVAKGRKMKEEMGVSYKTYLSLAAATEIFYTIGAAMILSAMGVNVMQHLADLDIWQFCKVIYGLDVSTIRIIGIVGWAGFIINRGVSFLSPGYLLLVGGKKLPRYFLYSALTEVTLEVVMTVLIFITLRVG